MKLWKKTVCLMLVTLLVSLALVGGTTLYITAKRSTSNAAETYGRQMKNAAGMMNTFWDEGKYSRMTEIGKKSYRNFQFRQCCGDGFALVKGSEVEDNFTGYEIVDADALDIEDSGDTYDYRIQRLSGKVLMLQKTVLQQPQGYFLIYIRDITGLVSDIKKLAMWYLGIYAGIFLLAGFFIYRMMQKNIQAMEELQEVAGRQEMLLGALAHEMKTPLTSIIGYSDSLLHVKLTEEQEQRALSHINREGRRLEILSGKLLQMMGLYQNDTIHMEEGTAGELLSRVEEMETEAAWRKGILLETECEDFSLQMDMELMESLLLNLIDNALRVSKPGHKVIVRAFCRGKEKFFQVEDFGCGIPAEELAKVTEAFYMVDKSRSRREGGVGLGLALCAKIAELHGGKMEIQSTQGKGTAVTVGLT